MVVSAFSQAYFFQRLQGALTLLAMAKLALAIGERQGYILPG
jgi:hypothetical protein